MDALIAGALAMSSASIGVRHFGHSALEMSTARTMTLLYKKSCSRPVTRDELIIGSDDEYPIYNAMYVVEY
jgi:hypothetical protein